MKAVIRSSLVPCEPTSSWDSHTGPPPADVPATWPAGGVHLADRKRLDPALRTRLAEAAKPPKPAKRPGLVARMLGRGGPAITPNGHVGLTHCPEDDPGPG